MRKNTRGIKLTDALIDAQIEKYIQAAIDASKVGDVYHAPNLAGIITSTLKVACSMMNATNSQAAQQFMSFLDSESRNIQIK